MIVQPVRSMVCDQMVKLFEALKTKPYRDAVGILTVGWGHVLLAGEEVREYTIAECEGLLANDLAVREPRLVNYYAAHDVKLAQHEVDALLSMAFNIGVGAVCQSTLSRLLIKGERLAAAREFRRWVYAGGQRLRGLERRRNAEAVRFLGGDYELVRAMWGNS